MEEHSSKKLERVEQNKLFLKKFERIDIHLTRLETMLHKHSLQMSKILSQEKKILKKEQEIDAELKKLEKFEKSLEKESRLLMEEESVIEEMLLKRQEEDLWFSIIMHDCPQKYVEKTKLLCMKNNKDCLFRNCPRKRELKKLTK